MTTGLHSFQGSSLDCTLHTAINHMITVLEWWSLSCCSYTTQIHIIPHCSNSVITWVCSVQCAMRARNLKQRETIKLSFSSVLVRSCYFTETSLAEALLLVCMCDLVSWHTHRQWKVAFNTKVTNQSLTSSAVLWNHFCCMHLCSLLYRSLELWQGRTWLGTSSITNVVAE